MSVKPKLRSGAGRSNVDSETPSGAIIAAATALTEVVTESGMRISFRKMSASREMQLSRIFETAVVNNMFYQWCWLAACVAEINGDTVIFPATTSECQAIIERIGDEGIAELYKSLIAKK